jgi:hypothetical protein
LIDTLALLTAMAVAVKLYMEKGASKTGQSRN